MKTKNLISAIFLFVVIASCKKQNIGNPGKNEVWLEYQAFVPTQLSVPVGTTITFTNKDNANHTATDTHNTFDSGTIKSGNTYSYTFNTKGTYYFFCNYHSSNPAEEGAILVQ